WNSLSIVCLDHQCIDVAIVHNICDVPEHFFSKTGACMYSLDVEVTTRFRGAVQVLGTVEVEMVGDE
ncbi:hypothetical protein MUP59_11465, partial [Candidatus Bathyarchaeota archaeon]|nr:hypothetical protein [Candidatus Bathyarchaeota archaeon]